MTNLTPADYQRIITQRISPLYISVHSSDPLLRSRLMGYRKDFDIIERMQWLSEYGIRFHTQIVVVPGWNDGNALTDTILALVQPDLNVISVGVVPVGLTRHRENLTKINPFTPDMASRTIEQVELIKSRLDLNNVYCADEFFIMAERPIPESEYYGDFCQIENGIGMMRMMLDNYQSIKRSFNKELRKKGKNIAIITGTSACGHITNIAFNIQKRIEPLQVRVLCIQNNFLGTTVSVSGLLTFTDITQQAVVTADDVVILPSNIFNYDGVTLDGYNQIDFKQKWQTDILLVDYLFEDWDWI